MTEFSDRGAASDPEKDGFRHRTDKSHDDLQQAKSRDTSLQNTKADTPDDQADSEWLGEDLEQAYQRALETNEAIEWEIGTGDENEASAEPADADTVSTNDDDQPTATETNGSATEPAVEAVASNQSGTIDELQGGKEGLTSRVKPEQVVEAALFVGDKPLTTKKLNHLLRGDDAHGLAEEMVDKLNLQYAEEHRPYEIRLGEGGYRMALRPEFDRVRNRVYGLGPKDVKLSQDVLEVLAVVAYKQPVSKKQIEELGKQNPGSPLGQLLRRELISIQRGENKRKDIKYVTTPRFLSLFGLSDIDELPQADELELK